MSELISQILVFSCLWAVAFGIQEFKYRRMKKWVEDAQIENELNKIRLRGVSTCQEGFENVLSLLNQQVATLGRQIREENKAKESDERGTN